MAQALGDIQMNMSKKESITAWLIISIAASENLSSLSFLESYLIRCLFITQRKLFDKLEGERGSIFQFCEKKKLLKI